MKFKLMFLALFVTYVGLLNAVPSAQYGDYSISKRSEKTKNSHKESSGVKSLNGHNKDDDNDLNIHLVRQLEILTGVLGALSSMAGSALDLGTLLVGNPSNSEFPFGRAEEFSESVERIGDNNNGTNAGGSGNQPLHKDPSTKFQKGLELISGEIEERDNPYMEQIHKLRRMLDSRGFRKALELLDSEIENQTDTEDSDDEND